MDQTFPRLRGLGNVAKPTPSFALPFLPPARVERVPPPHLQITATIEELLLCKNELLLRQIGGYISLLSNNLKSFFRYSWCNIPTSPLTFFNSLSRLQKHYIQASFGFSHPSALTVFYTFRRLTYSLILHSSPPFLWAASGSPRFESSNRSRGDFLPCFFLRPSLSPEFCLFVSKNPKISLSRIIWGCLVGYCTGEKPMKTWHRIAQDTTYWIDTSNHSHLVSLGGLQRGELLDILCSTPILSLSCFR